MLYQTKALLLSKSCAHLNNYCLNTPLGNLYLNLFPENDALTHFRKNLFVPLTSSTQFSEYQEIPLKINLMRIHQKASNCQVESLYYITLPSLQKDVLLSTLLWTHKLVLIYKEDGFSSNSSIISNLSSLTALFHFSSATLLVQVAN